MNLIERVETWYRGQYIPPPPNDPDSPVVFISFGHYEQPLLAKVLGVIGRFYLAHWQWVIGTGLAIAGLVVAA